MKESVHTLHQEKNKTSEDLSQIGVLKVKLLMKIFTADFLQKLNLIAFSIIEVSVSNVKPQLQASTLLMNPDTILKMRNTTYLTLLATHLTNLSLAEIL